MKRLAYLIFIVFSHTALAEKNSTQTLLDAISENNLNEARIAIDNGADVNHERFYDSYTPLMQTAVMNTPQMTVILIKAAADINHVTIRGRTALQIAALNNSYEVALVLASDKNMDTNHGDKNCALAIASREAHLKIVKILISLTDEQTPNQKCYSSALKYAERSTNDDILKLLNP